ncbi:MAG: hypothetical protein WBW24_04495, partial [Candidatus Sulfotelmatobacter sp.]
AFTSNFCADLPGKFDEPALRRGAHFEGHITFTAALGIPFGTIRFVSEKTASLRWLVALARYQTCDHDRYEKDAGHTFKRRNVPHIRIYGHDRSKPTLVRVTMLKYRNVPLWV